MKANTLFVGFLVQGAIVEGSQIQDHSLIAKELFYSCMLRKKASLMFKVDFF